MRIQFCGANRTVTGSCHLVEVNGLRLLLDLGMYQGPREEARRINHYQPPDAKNPDAIILSHGHLDHCGKLPVATRQGFDGPVYCTPATAEVARIVLEDAAEIQLEDAVYLNQRSREPGAPPVEPLYEPGDVREVIRRFKRVNYDVRTELGNGVSFTFHDAGHILGSAYVLLEWNEAGADRRLLFTADVGRYGSPIIRDPQPPPGGPVDVLITESTYGNAVHAPMDQVEPQLLDAVRHCVQHKSRLIVPSFAVGRTQVILWFIQKFISQGSIPAIPIFVDSPMGVEASKVHTIFRDNYDEETRELIGKKDLYGLSHVTFAATREQSMAVNSQAGACVIIASSPTCEFGWVLHHVKRSVEQPDDVIVFVGWTPPNTLGRRLQDGQRKVRIYDRWYDLKCQVRTIHGLSAHADGEELLRFLRPAIAAGRTAAAYVVHGEVPQAEAFAARLLEAGVGSVYVPAMETSAAMFSAPQRKATAPLPVRTDND